MDINTLIKAISESFSGKISPVGTMIMSFKLTIGKMSILGIDAVHNEAIISIFSSLSRVEAQEQQPVTNHVNRRHNPRCQRRIGD